MSSERQTCVCGEGMHCRCELRAAKVNYGMCREGQGANSKVRTVEIVMQMDRCEPRVANL